MNNYLISKSFSKIKLSLVVTLIAASIFSFATPVFAQEAVLPGFNPNRIIEDSVFSDKTALGSPEAIQKFLESKGSVLANTNPDFLAKLHEPNVPTLKTSLEDPRPNLDHLRTAAEIIWDASVASGINPQVTIVTLQKEQSLITGRQTATADQIQRALDFAMGFGCPDSGGCGDLYRGFYFQLFGNLDSEGNRYLGATKSLMKSFSTPGGRGPFYNGAAAKVGDTIVLGNTVGGFSGVLAQQTVTIENAASAALYRYTPHVFNGNYNFWRYMNQWFRYPSGTIISTPGGQIYMIQNGSRMSINDFIARARGLNTSSPIQLSYNELDSYPDGGLLGLADNTVVIADGKTYVFISNKKYPVTDFVLRQRGLANNAPVTATTADLAAYQDGTQLTPSEGTVLRGVQGPSVYIVQNNILRLVSALVFAQRNLAPKIQLIPDTELALYPKGGFLPPANGTLVKSPHDQTVSLIVDQVKRPITYFIFKTYGFKFTDVKTISDDELAAIPVGALAEPKDQTYYKVDPGGDLYVYSKGSKHYISAFVAKQKKITPDTTLTAAETAAWAEGSAITPKDGTLLKADNSGAVYIVENGQLTGLSLTDFQARKLSFKNVVVLPATEVARYPLKGSGQQ